MKKHKTNNSNNKSDSCVDYAKDAFLSNPIPSATENTGYVQRIPQSDFEAASYEEMFDVPVSYDEKDKS